MNSKEEQNVTGQLIEVKIKTYCVRFERLTCEHAEYETRNIGVKSKFLSQSELNAFTSPIKYLPRYICVQTLNITKYDLLNDRLVHTYFKISNVERPRIIMIKP